METQRQQKVARLLQKDLSEILINEAREAAGGRMLTITSVRMSPDLSLAKIYLSIFPSSDAKTWLETFQHHIARIRLELGRRVRHQLRIVPELAFFIDDSLDYAEHIDNLLKQADGLR